MKKFFLRISIIVFVVMASYWSYRARNNAELNDLLLANVEAFANDEYVIGPIGSNWKTYRTQCTRVIGWDYILKYEITTTYWTDVCGSGSGGCLYPAGC